jgi:TolA-binding protein
MKKLFSGVMIFLFALTLAGCTNENQVTDLEAQITDLQNSITELETSLENAEGLNEDYEAEIRDLESQISELEALIYDNVLTITFLDEYGAFESSTIGYNDDFDGSLFDLIDANFELGYFSSDYGKFIHTIKHLSPKNGAYIAYSKNGVMSTVGVETQTFKDKDVFAFEVLWYDELEEMVDDAIQLFLANQVDDFVSPSSIHYQVIAALDLLGMTEDFVTSAEAQSYVDGLTLTTYTDYVKAITILNNTGNDSEDYISSLNDIAATGDYGKTGYTLALLNSADTDVDFTAFETSALDYYDDNTPYDAGLDTGGVDLIALSYYSDDTDVEALINQYLTWIQTDQLASGGIETRDMGWGSSENAASIAQVIIGLLANGENPAGDDYTVGENNLVSRLIEFQTDSGSFDWDLTDDIDEDVLFSTPQAFLALVMYQSYSNNPVAPVIPYE